MKRVLSIILVAAMAISMLVVMPTTVVAIPAGNAISSAGEFTAMEAAGTYYLTADITVSATYETEFSGTFDGNGYKITVSQPLFESVSGTVKNLTVEGAVDFSAVSDNAGAVAKVANGATFTNVTNRASVSGYTTTYDNGNGVRMATAGGVVGMAIGNCTFTNVTNEGAINGYNTGGIVGMLASTETGVTNFSHCANSGAITAVEITIQGTSTDPLYFGLQGNLLAYGGIVGLIFEYGTVNFSYCSNSGNMDNTGITYNTGDPYAPMGGIYGVATYTRSATNPPSMTVALDNCSNTAAVKGIRQTGGLVGWAGYIDSVSVSNCTNSGAIESTTSYTGGLLGRGSEGETYIANCTNEATASVISSTSQAGGIVGYMESNATILSCVNNANLSNPTLNVGGIVGAKGSTDAGLFIKDCTNNGNITGVKAAGIIGNLTSPNNTIINCLNTATIIGNCIGGILGYSTADMIMYGCINRGALTTEHWAGGILGWNQGVTHLNNCINEETGIIDVDPDTSSYCGGVAGRIGPESSTDTSYDRFITVNNCINYADVTGTATNNGGVVGYITMSGEVSNCYNYGDITGPASVAGVVASWNVGKAKGRPGAYYITNCGNEGNITSVSGTDGAAGVIRYTYASSTLYPVVDGCYSIGNLSSTQGPVYGIFGYANSTTPVVKNCYVAGTFSTPTEGQYSYAIAYDKTAPATGNFDKNYCQAEGADYLYLIVTDKQAIPTDYAYLYAAADLATGKLANDINTNAGKDVFYQTLPTDTHPVSNNAHKAVRLDGGTYYNLLKATFQNGYETIYVDAAAGENFEIPEDDGVLYWTSGTDKVMPNVNTQITVDKIFTSNMLALETDAGAAVRMTAGSTGLRFYTNIDKSDYDAVVADLAGSSYSVSYGTIVAPQAYVTEAGAFTMAALGELVKTSPTYLQIPAIEAYQTNENAYLISGSITNLGAVTGKNDHRNVDFAAVGYVCITDSLSSNSYYLYSNTYSTRNVSSVANSALNDVSDTQVAGYGHVVEGGTHNAKYSPYTTDQRAILESLVVVVD